MNTASEIGSVRMAKRLTKFLRLATAFLLMASFFFSPLGPQFFIGIRLGELANTTGIQRVLAAASGDGIIVYGKSGTATPQYRLYAYSTNTWGAETPVGGATFSGTPRFIVVKASASRDEAVIGVLNDTGTLFMVLWDGSSWSQLGSNIETGVGDAKVFDIIYENTSGDAMVVVGGAVDPSYYIWNGSTWSGPTTITQATKTTGTIRWIELASRKTSGSDEVALVYADNAGDLNALIWSGSAWTEQTAAAGALSTGIEDNAGATTMRAFDVEYESLSGDLMITWGNNATVDPRYVTRSAAGTWSGVLTASTFVEIPSIMNIATEPWGDRIAVGLQNDTKTNSNDGDCGIWNGTGWVNTVNCDIARDSQEAGDMVLGSGWVQSGADTRAINFYSDVADLTLDYNYWVPGTGWTSTQSFTPSPNCIAASSDDNSFVTETNPFDDTQLMVVRQSGTAICTQKTNYAGANTFNFGNAGDGSSLATPSVSQYQPVGFAYFRFIPNTLTIGAASGSKVTTVDSGATSVVANTTGCGAPSSCAAFTLNVSGSTVTITSIKITETGTANATTDLSNLALLYDTDGNYSNGTTGQYGGTVASFTSETATVNGSLVLTPGTTYYFYVRFDVKSGTPTYPKGGQTINFQIASNSDVVFTGSATASGAPATLAGTTTILPNATDSTFGSGLSDGGRSGESITISGFGFGVAPGGSRANCSSAVDTGCVRFVLGGNDTVADASISAWSNTSITFTIASALATEGGSAALEVVSGSQSDGSDLDFFVYPNITAVAVCSGCNANSAREHATGVDTDGLVMLSGDHFGSAGSVTILGSTATQHGVVEGACTSSDYGDTATCLEVPTAISDSLYTGNIVLTRTSDSKTHTSANFRILPRIISNTPVSDVVGNVIQVDGNHFCESGTCPVSPNLSTSADNVKFNSTQALNGDFVTTPNCSGASKWSHTQICVKVPAGTPSGSAPTAITSNTTFISNSKAFTVQSTIPNDPTGLNQFESTGVTAITVGSSTNISSVVLRADISSSLSINMAIQVEATSTSNSFGCSGTGACSYAVQGTVNGGGACTNCTSLSGASTTVSSLADGTYHWQMRVRNTTTNEYSNWVSFNGGGTGFVVDTTPATITFIPTDTCAGGSGNPGSNTATISWSLNESADGQVEYSKNSDLSVSTNYPATPEASDVSHTINLSNLDSGTTYYFKVKSRDAAGNLGTKLPSSPFCSFVTQSVSQPAKTVMFHIVGATSSIAGGTTATSSFTVVMPEAATSTKSAFVEIRGIFDTTGSLPNGISVKVNSQATSTYAIPTGSASKSHFKFIYQLSSVNTDPATNTLYITPETNTTLYINSADIYVTYAYTP